jgi:hypothetical protein
MSAAISRHTPGGILDLPMPPDRKGLHSAASIISGSCRTSRIASTLSGAATIELGWVSSLPEAFGAILLQVHRSSNGVFQAVFDDC